MIENSKKEYGDDLLSVSVPKEALEKEYGDTKEACGKAYEQIIALLKQYIDVTEEQYHIITLWIIGTYFHKEFNTFPFLFLNATKGSGKTRTLRLISYLQKNGDGMILNKPSESVLFRTAQKTGLILDEVENIGKKESSLIRETLNAAYKKGGVVTRMRKVVTKEGENQQAESFNLYTPVAMANIWGMEDVLGDRCISLVLEKSTNPAITLMIEDFDANPTIQEIKRTFSVVSVMSLRKKNYIMTWNDYVKERYNDTNSTNIIYNRNSTYDMDQLELFNTIHQTGIMGRNLELFFPLFIIANFISKEILDKTIKFATQLVEAKKEDDMAESRDVVVMQFVSKLDPLFQLNYNPLMLIATKFKEFVGEHDDQEDSWANIKWLGRALKRMNLITNKRRVTKGREIMLNISKAKQKVGGVSKP